ncbi:hypothetical protein TRFO_23647 [Tritrichomonas foetus]|uniref:Uncharacterized protein n=1 Tax=Tritrichomonas foetus TaxID=1144522 RepID=A0A1J4KF71_9EUKA|nr:hypothetical protein TRFO_23647 [Tritrichomonas foetus]|eukprot:OHT08021.1 hypothetical protein TRFO_23647 [Tritrichomonas foetus]
MCCRRIEAVFMFPVERWLYEILIFGLAILPLIDHKKTVTFEHTQKMDEEMNLTCFVVSPAIKCEIWENLALGAIFYICAIICFYFLFQNWKNSKRKCKLFDQTILFWIWLIIFLLFRGTISIVPFTYNYITIKIIFLGCHHILLFIPMCLVILILFDLLFTYQNPGTNAINFFRSLFLLFLATFVALGVVLSIIDLNDETTDPEMSLSLWVACTDFILMLFFVLPAVSLLRVVTYPMVQPEDKSCVMFCRLGIILNTTIFCLRMLYNFLHYIDFNPIQDWILSENANNPGYAKNNNYFIPNTKVRIWSTCYYIIFDCVPCILAIFAVNMFKQHDMMFNENPYYTKQSD